MTFLQIDKVKLQNIRCFDNLELDFNNGVNVITGPNGSGKSTVLTAIGFGLFGATYLNGLNMKTDDLIMRGKESGRITLTFLTDNGKYTSSHIIKANKSNSWRVAQEGIAKPVSQTIEDSREVIQMLLGNTIDHNIYHNAICSRQGEITKLLNLRPKERKDQVRRILGLEKFDIASNHMRKVMSRIQQKIEEIDKEMGYKQQDLRSPDNIAKEIDKQKKQLQKLKATEKKKQNDLKQLETSFKSLHEIRNRISQLQKSIETTKLQLANQQAAIDEKNQDLQKQSKKLQYEQIDLKTANDTITSLNTAITKDKIELKDVDMEIEQFNKQKDELEAREREITSFLSQKTALREKIDKVLGNKTLGDIKTQQQTLEREFSIYQTKKDNATKNLESGKKNQKRLKTMLQRSQNEITSIHQQFSQTFGKEYSAITEVESELETKHQSLKKAKQNLTSYLEKTRKQIGKVDGEITLHQNSLKLIEESPSEVSCPVCHQSLSETSIEDLRNEHQQYIETLQTELQTVQSQFDQQKESIQTLEDKLRDSQKQRLALEHYLGQTERVQALTEQRTKDESDLVKMEEEIKTIQKELDELMKQDAEELKKQLDHLSKAITVVDENQKAVRDLDTKSAEMAKLVAQVKERLSLADMEALMKKKSALKTKVGENETILEALTAKIVPLLQDIFTLATKISTQLEQNQRDRELLAELQKDFDGDEYQKLETDIESINEEIIELKSDIISINRQLPDLQQELEKHTKLHNDLQELQSKRKQLEQINPTSGLIREIFDNTPDLLIAKISDAVSTHITNLIKRLLPNRGFERIIFQHDGDLIIYNNGKRVDKNTLSGGEKTVIALSLRLALADFVAPLKFLILDEPTNHLDRERVEEFLEIIDRERLFNSSQGQLLLVTHREEFDRNASNSIRLEVSADNRRFLVT